MSITGKAVGMVAGKYILTSTVSVDGRVVSVSVEEYDHGYMFLICLPDGYVTNRLLYSSVKAALTAADAVARRMTRDAQDARTLALLTPVQ